MKKLGVLAFLSLGLITYAQQGKVGINEEAPQATLEIKVADANVSGNSKEGILIPRVTAARAEAMGTDVAESTLLYITDGTAGTGTTSLVNGKGFYYFDTTDQKWKKVGGGDSTTAPQTWEQIRYGANGKYMIPTDRGSVIPKDTWLAIGTETVADVRLPELTQADAGKMIVVSKEGSGNLQVLDHNGLVAGMPGTVMYAVSTIGAFRGRAFIWDGQYWRTTNY